MRRNFRVSFKLKRLQTGGRRTIRLKQWGKFTVKYSMKRFLEAGGGALVITLKSEKWFAVITNKTKKNSKLKS
jgi:hypothetical protein